MLNILFRTAGGRARKKQLGLGHVYRCANLAEYLKPNAIHFLLENYNGADRILRGKGFNKILIIKKNISVETDINKTIRYIKKNKINILIIDKYGIQLRYINGLKKIVKTIIISDLKKTNFNCELLINGFIGLENKIVINKYGTKCMLGPSYQILNKKFLKGRKARNKKIKLLATFGGFDENNISTTIINSIKKLDQKIKTKIILGPTTKIKKQNFALQKYQQWLDISNDAKDMYNEMCRTEYGICSGGITSYEFATLGIPFGIVCQNKHQLLTAHEWENRGFAINLGLFNKKTPQKIDKFLEMIQFNPETNKSHIIKVGRGIKQIINEISKLKE